MKKGDGNLMSFSSELEKWFTERPLWLQDAARRLILNGEISYEDIVDLTSLCKEEVGLKGAIELSIKAKPIPKGSLVVNEENSELKLVSIGNVRGINALAPRNPLEFMGKPLTVIYGSNGSGKSSYMRVLKHSCGARSAGSLLGNVFNSTQDEPGCTFKIEKSTGLIEFEWKPADGVHTDLRQIELYDTDCASIYINNENEVSYEPSILSIFTKISKACDEVAKALQKEIESVPARKPKMPDKYEKTVAGLWYKKLNAKTTDKEVDLNCRWTKELESELGKIRTRLAEADPTEKAKVSRKNCTGIKRLIENLNKINNMFSEGKCSEYITIKNDSQNKRILVNEDAKRVFGNSELNGVGKESWRLLWEQARVYSTSVAYPQNDFPYTEDGARCVLCQQPLGIEAQERLKQFEKFVIGELQKIANQAEKKFQSVQKEKDSIFTQDNLVLQIDASGITEEITRQSVLEFYNAVMKRKQSLFSADSIEELTPQPDNKVLKVLEDMKVALETQVSQYEEDAKGENRDGLTNRILEIEAMKWAYEQKTSIQDEVKRLALIDYLNAAKNLTNTKALSLKKSAMSEELITKDYVNRFNAELKALGAHRIKVEICKTKAQKGHIYHQIKLKGSPTAKASEVLSEGELRIVSIAAFLADVEGRQCKTPFIFDDPISSLDQDFEEATVKRLVKLSKNRQVIVFTHRISMLALLQDLAKGAGIDTHVICVRSENWGVGEPGDTPLFAKNPIGVINNLVGRTKTARKILNNNGRDEYDNYAKGICSDLRIALERLIETSLLAEVVQRFRRSVTTLNRIHKLAAIEQKDCKLFDDLMTKYSYYEHSQPNEMPVPLPAPDEIIEDLEMILEWEKEFKNRSEGKAIKAK